MQVLPHVTLLVMLIHTLVTTVLENPFLISSNFFKLSWDFVMFNILGQDWSGVGEMCSQGHEDKGPSCRVNPFWKQHIPICLKSAIHHIQTSSRQPTYQRSGSGIRLIFHYINHSFVCFINILYQQNSEHHHTPHPHL